MMKWGWGWSPGDQETGEFKILEAYFSAYLCITNRIRSFEFRAYGRPSRALSFWIITMLDNTVMEVPA